MSETTNTYDLVVSGETITITTFNVAFLMKESDTYKLYTNDQRVFTIAETDYNAIKALDYSNGGTYKNAIHSTTIQNMQYSGSTLYIDETPFAGGGGGSNMVLDESTGELSGATNTSGESVTINVNTITFTI